MDVRTILVPIDFSDPSAAALALAADLAGRYGAKLHLLHAHQLTTTVYPYGMIIGEDVERRVQEAAREKLESWCERATKLGATAEATVSPGTPAESILQLAKELPADMIVMGTRGLSGLKHVMLGSVTERTVRLAPCPVVTVHGEDDDED